MVAIGWQLFDSFATGDSVDNPNLNPVCGRKIRASCEPSTSLQHLIPFLIVFRFSPDGGKSVDVVALDRCGGCQEYE